jgi:hypothetical protein
MATDTFLLMPIDADSLALALEDWSIWRRWVCLNETTVVACPAATVQGRGRSACRFYVGQVS